MTRLELDALTRERLEMAAYILRNHAALIMYAANNGEDLTTARRRLLSMLQIRTTNSSNVPRPADGKSESSQDYSDGSLELSSHEMSE